MDGITEDEIHSVLSLHSQCQRNREAFSCLGRWLCGGEVGVKLSGELGLNFYFVALQCPALGI